MKIEEDFNPERDVAFGPLHEQHELIAQVRAVAKVPIMVKGKRIECEFISFYGLPSKREHFAIGFPGWQSSQEPPVKLHSEKLLDDLFQSQRHSQKYSEGDALSKSMEKLSEIGGLLLYFREADQKQGLYDLLDGIVFEDRGYPALIESKVRRFELEERHFNDAAHMLKALRLSTIQLLEKTWDKVLPLELRGIRISNILSS